MWLLISHAFSIIVKVLLDYSNYLEGWLDLEDFDDFGMSYM